MSQNNNFAYRV